jgi:hypothetical protein
MPTGFPTRGIEEDSTLLGQAIPLIGQPDSGDYLPVNSVVNRSDYPDLSNLYPAQYSRINTVGSLGQGIHWSDMAYDGKFFIAVSGRANQGTGYEASTTNTDVIGYSSDGITFNTTVAMPQSTAWCNIIFEDGIFVALHNATNNGYRAAWSYDGFIWNNTLLISSTLYPVCGLVYLNGVFATFGSGNPNIVWHATTATIKAGGAWSSYNNSFGNLTPSCFSKNVNGIPFRKVVTGTTYNTFHYNPTNLATNSWLSTTLPALTAYNNGSLVWTGQKYVMLNNNSTNNILTACHSSGSNIASWSTFSIPWSSNIPIRLSYIDGVFIAFGINGTTCLTSFDNGYTWSTFTIASTPTTINFYNPLTNKIIVIFRAQTYCENTTYGYSSTLTLSGPQGGGWYVRVK